NKCYHRVIKNAPYAVVLGYDSKIGHASASLNPSIFGKIQTEEDIIPEFDLPPSPDDNESEADDETRTNHNSKNDQEEHEDGNER
ncbi:unnamed protein product, partial [Didymodactylos carnosus]